MLLNKIIENKVFSFEEGFNTWQEALYAAGKPLIKEGYCELQYIDAVVACVEKFGPYIVIAPNIAMPHSTEGAEGVNKTTIGFMKTEKPVHFDLEDPERDARLFFTLVSANHDEHLENMMALSTMLMNEEIVEELLLSKSVEDLAAIADKYQDS
jgi:PTS system ascorbate-specific IIA component